MKHRHTFLKLLATALERKKSMIFNIETASAYNNSLDNQEKDKFS